MTPRSAIDDYRAGAWSAIAGAELFAAGVYLLALRATRGIFSRMLDRSILVVADAVGLAVASTIAFWDRDEDVEAGMLVGLLVVAIVWVLLRGLAGRPVSLRGVVVALALAIGLGAVLYVEAIFAVFAPELLVGQIGVVAVLAFGWAALRLDRERRLSWESLAVTAAFFAVVVVPSAGGIIMSRGHGPFVC